MTPVLGKPQPGQLQSGGCSNSSFPMRRSMLFMSTSIVETENQHPTATAECAELRHVIVIVIPSEDGLGHAAVPGK